MRIAGSNLNLFEFDYDLTWFAFFLNADETIYGRYGGRDARSPDSRNTLAGLRFALERALEAHQQHEKVKTESTKLPVVRAEDYPAARTTGRNNCIHCHQVNEFRRAQLQAEGKWTRELLWAYPLPENIGIQLDKDEGNLVKGVFAQSAAAAVGLQPGDRIEKLNGFSVHSFADAQHALHKAPSQGAMPLTWLRDGKPAQATLRVAEGWRKTNITWRPSLLDILPSLPASGEDLSAVEKRGLGIPEKGVAFRQDKFVHSTLKKIGLQKDDVIIGLEGLKLEGTMEDFLGYVRSNYLVGDKVTINVLRNGKPVDLPITLK